MSANTEVASRRGQGPADNAPSGAALQEAGLTSTHKPLICVDLDDVLSQTNRVVGECRSKVCPPAAQERTDQGLSYAGHNDTYGTHMTLDDFHCECIAVHRAQQLIFLCSMQITITGG